MTLTETQVFELARRLQEELYQDDVRDLYTELSIIGRMGSDTLMVVVKDVHDDKKTVFWSRVYDDNTLEGLEEMWRVDINEFGRKR